MTAYGPYIILGVVAIVLLVIMRLQLRTALKSTTQVEGRLADLERKISDFESGYRDEIRKAGAEKDLKITQLRDELRTTLDSFVEATGNKLAESAALQKSLFDQLAERIAASNRQEVRQAGPKAAPLVQPQATRQSPAHEKAKRLARLIVSDIVLYNQAAVDEGVRNNTFAELLAHDIQEARALYAQRIPEEIRNGTSYLEEAFSELIARKKRELNVG